MQNLNAEYTGRPVNFLTNRVLTMNPSIVGSAGDPRELQAGLQHFDIRPLAYPGGTELKFFADAGQGQHIGKRLVGNGAVIGSGGIAALAGRMPTLQSIGVIWRAAPAIRPEPREAPIRAYWLPYEADQTHELMLGDKADFFFTAGLSGCCVVVSGDPCAPRVAHINRTEAGNGTFQKLVARPYAAAAAAAGMPPSAGRFGKEVQTDRQIMFQGMKTSVAAKASGRSTVGDLNGRCKWGQEYENLCGVVGIRNPNSGRWTFYFQKYTNVAAPPHLRNLGFITLRDGPLRTMA